MVTVGALDFAGRLRMFGLVPLVSISNVSDD